MFFCLAKLIPAATSATSVALIVYTGWSPIEQVPTAWDAVPSFDEHELFCSYPIVHGDSVVVALTGGHEFVGYERAMGLLETKAWIVNSLSRAAQSSALYAGPG